MKKNLLMGAIIGLIIITLFLVFGKFLYPGPKLEITGYSWDFGEVKAGSDLKHTFIIKNTGNAKLTLNVYPSCPKCIHAELEKQDLPPKSETKLQVELFPDEVGPFKAYAMLESNDPAKWTTKLTIKCMNVKQ